MKDRIISLLSEVDRKGIDNLIKFIEDSNYLTSAQCYSHHKCQHGLMMHSLEVLDCMLNNNLAGIPRESIILVALCHDLGKARLRGRKVGAGPHPSRSISILKRCGVELTKDDLLIDMAQKEGYVSECDNNITVVLDTNLTEELLEDHEELEIVNEYLIPALDVVGQKYEKGESNHEFS